MHIKSEDKDAPSIYWDYIQLDLLLGIQNTKTSISDEKVFLTYHQIVELYYSLVLHELNRLIRPEVEVDVAFFAERLLRMNRYLCHIINAFEVLTYGLDTEEFLRFRRLLGNASGFQSVQHRKIEIAATDLAVLSGNDSAQTMGVSDDLLMRAYQSLYWRCISEFASDDSAKRMLNAFEARYRDELIAYARMAQPQNLWQRFMQDFKDNAEIRELLKRFDRLFNLDWKEAHLGAAIHHMSGMHRVERATGGSNWRQYLVKGKRVHPVFYPELWEASELKAFEERCMALVTNSN
ncbi:MAG TPA: tryptophan 2,3-dioxygenase [Opitutae bacterium]|nr:tryptophan 2,3-dioxygenase [Opitutae bacterium]